MVTTPQEDFLPLVEGSDFLPPIGFWAKLGGLFIVGAVGVAIALASVTKYKVTVKAQATVRPVSGLRIIQAATAGTITRIAVKENQVVKTGDVIATIDNSRLQTRKSQLKSNIQQAQLQLMQINAQISATDSQIRAETDADFRGRRRSYQEKQITTVTEVQEAEANIKIAQEELHVAQAELKSAYANLRATQASLVAARIKRNRYETVAKQGAISQDQFEEVQLAFEQQSSAVEAQKAVVEVQKQKIEQQQQAVSAAVARWQSTQATINPRNAEIAIASEHLAQEKATGAANLATLTKERQALIQQQIQISKQLEYNINELQQVEIDIKQTIISAPANGTLFQLKLRNSNQTVQPGEEIAQIVPSHSILVVKALVSAEDIGKVKIGQKAQLQISACPYPDYGTLKGQVNAISPDVIVPQGNGAMVTTATTASTAFYEVTIQPENLFLGTTNNQCAIQVGMEGAADIISKEETLLLFFLRKARLRTNL
ncbi:MAG: HlyD family efflux transporter periplasmic adaptor subunit [Fischerella sp. CENA71]|nr:HlyD family efflux transporter periplasmic adaptor subunit [Fischerella sp. CENA71]